MDVREDTNTCRGVPVVRRARLKQAEIDLDQERALRTKISDDCTALVQENALLGSQMSELQKVWGEGGRGGEQNYAALQQLTHAPLP